MIEATHEAEVKALSDAATGLVWGGTTEAPSATALLCFYEPLSSRSDADRFGVDLERRYRLHVDLGDEAYLPVGAIVRTRPIGGAEWSYNRVETAPVRHEANDECDHAECAVERLEKYAGWA